MQVTIRAQGHLKQYCQTPVTLNLPDGATVRMMLDAAGVPWEEVGLVAVNGQQAADDAALHDGDQIMLLAPMEGG